MARRMKLVPDYMWRELMQEKTSKAKPEYSFSVVEPKQETDLRDLAEFLPKSYRSKARMLLHYLQGHIELNEQQRVIYPDGQLGSHILDLVKFTVSPFSRDRPLDQPKFKLIMDKAGVPKSAIAKKAK